MNVSGHEQQVRLGLDGLAIANVVAVWVGWLPHIAAALSIIWLLMQIVEKLTGKRIPELCKWLFDRVFHRGRTPW